MTLSSKAGKELQERPPIHMWKGIVGKGFTAKEFRNYVSGLKFTTWRPRFVVVHNTEVPSMADWHGYSGEVRMRGLEGFYRDEKGWSAGPHLFIADDFIWVFTPLTLSGVHSPSWNSFSWGVEVVGDYAHEALSGDVESNAVSAIATLHEVIGLDPASMRPHRDDPKTTHKTCPGPNLDMTRLRQAVTDELENRQIGEHAPGALLPEVFETVIVKAMRKVKKPKKGRRQKPTTARRAKKSRHKAK